MRLDKTATDLVESVTRQVARTCRERCSVGQCGPDCLMGLQLDGRLPGGAGHSGDVHWVHGVRKVGEGLNPHVTSGCSDAGGAG